METIWLNSLNVKPIPVKNLNLNKIVGVNPSDNTEKQGFSCCSKVNLKKIDYLQSKNQMTACKILNIHIMT